MATGNDFMANFSPLLVTVFKQRKLLFKYHNTYFHILFHPHVFSHTFSPTRIFTLLKISYQTGPKILSFLLFIYWLEKEFTYLEKNEHSKSPLQELYQGLLGGGKN